MSRLGAITLLLCLATASVSGQRSQPVMARQSAALVHKDATADEVLHLIDQLQEARAPGQPPGGAAGQRDLTVGDLPRPGGFFIAGMGAQYEAPAMEQLAALGARALPALLDHLTDARETRVVIKRPQAMWLSDEYSARFRNPKRQPPGVNRIGIFGGPDVDRYILRVGDLCYEVLGRIVNRGLVPVRYQPTLCLVINSPVQTRVLADAARRDWGGVTEAGHRQSLIRDVLSNPFSYEQSGALWKICSYYPGAGEAIAIRLLQQPYYDYQAVGSFVETELLDSPRISDCRRRIARFAATHRQADVNWVLRHLLWHFYDEPPSGSDRKRRKERALIVLKVAYPTVDPYEPPFANATTMGEKGGVIQALAEMKSAAIDWEVRRVYLALRPERLTGYGAMDGDVLFIACMDRLAGRDLDERFRSYLASRIRTMKAKKHLDTVGTYWLPVLEARLKRLRGTVRLGEGRRIQQERITRAIRWNAAWADYGGYRTAGT